MKGLFKTEDITFFAGQIKKEKKKNRRKTWEVILHDLIKRNLPIALFVINNYGHVLHLSLRYEYGRQRKTRSLH